MAKRSKTIIRCDHVNFDKIIREIADRTKLTQSEVTKQAAEILKREYNKKKDKSPFSLFD